MSESLARILYDSINSRVAKFIDDSGDSLLAVVGKLRNAAGTIVNPSTEDKQDSAITKLTSLDGKDFATQATLATLATETKLEAVRALLATIDADTSNLDVLLSTRATEATLALADGRLTTIDAVLDSIKDTDGIKKITDQLPAGTNEIGKVAQGTKAGGSGAWPVALYDAAGNLLEVQDGVAIPVDTKSLLLAGSDGTNARHLKTDAVGHLVTTTATLTDSAANMINLSHSENAGAYVPGQWRRVLTYTIPTGYAAYLIRFTTWQNESASSRVIIEKLMGELDFPTNVFTSGDAYTAPQWSDTHIVEAVVTTQLSLAQNVIVTVTYTNEAGVAGRTGTFSIAKNSIVGTRIVLAPQTGDIGVRSIQNMSVAPSGNAGAIYVQAALQLALHFDLSATIGMQTLYAPSAVAFPEGTVLGIEFSGGTVAKDRRIDTLIQLVA